jgi:hypothetical protein
VRNNISSLICSLYLGYKITPYTIRPYDETELRISNRQLRAQRLAFNKQHAGACSIVETTFGKLKGHFPILKLMPGRVMGRVYPLPEALIVLHNIFLDLSDSPADIIDFDPEDNAATMVQDMLNQNAHSFGDSRVGARGSQMEEDTDCQGTSYYLSSSLDIQAAAVYSCVTLGVTDSLVLILLGIPLPRRSQDSI